MKRRSLELLTGSNELHEADRQTTEKRGMQQQKEVQWRKRWEGRVTRSGIAAEKRRAGKQQRRDGDEQKFGGGELQRAAVREGRPGPSWFFLGQVFGEGCSVIFGGLRLGVFGDGFSGLGLLTRGRSAGCGQRARGSSSNAGRPAERRWVGVGGVAPGTGSDARCHARPAHSTATSLQAAAQHNSRNGQCGSAPAAGKKLWGMYRYFAQHLPSG